MVQHWPAWYFGPGGQAQIFESAADVPKGWKDNPAKVGLAEGQDSPLDSFDIGRDEAIAVLKEHGVPANARWGDQKLAEALKEILADDDGE